MTPFQEQGKTVTFAAAGSAPTPVQCERDAGSQAQQYLIVNNGTVTAFVGVGANAGQASARAVIPTSTPIRCYPVPAGVMMVITGPANAFFTGITATGTAAIYVTPGYGE